jgi:hypothetical protein
MTKLGLTIRKRYRPQNRTGVRKLPPTKNWNFPVKSREYYLQHRFAWHQDVSRFANHVNSLIGDKSFREIKNSIPPMQLQQLLQSAYALEDVAASSQKGDELFSVGTGDTKINYDTTEYKNRTRTAKLQLGRILANLKRKNSAKYIHIPYDPPLIQKPDLLHPK